jgi:hypothetical protein
MLAPGPGPATTGRCQPGCKRAQSSQKRAQSSQKHSQSSQIWTDDGTVVTPHSAAPNGGSASVHF